MSTGSFTITSVQPIAPTPPSVTPSSTSGDSKGFNALYQTTLNNSTPSQQDTSSSSSKSTSHSEAKDDTRATANAERPSSPQRRDKPHSTTDNDVASTQSARRKADQAKKPEDEAAKDMVASIAIEQMKASETQQPKAEDLHGTVMISPRKEGAGAVTAQQPSVSTPRNEALQQALALQQLMDQKHTEQTTTFSATDALKATAQNSVLQEISLSDRRELNAPEGLNVSSERPRPRTTPSVAASQTMGALLNQDAQTAVGLGKEDEFSVDGVASRSQADFDLQYALNQASGNHSHTQAASSSNLPPIDSEHWNDALASHISTMSRLDQGQTILTLAPASLGSLEVSLQMDRGQADIQFVTHSRQAHDALTSSVHSLHNALADQGIQLQNVSIVDNRPDAGQQTSQQQHAFSGMASDQQSSQHSAYQTPEQTASHDTATLSTQEERTDLTSDASTSSNTVHGLRATA